MPKGPSHTRSSHLYLFIYFFLDLGSVLIIYSLEPYLVGMFRARDFFNIGHQAHGSIIFDIRPHDFRSARESNLHRCALKTHIITIVPSGLNSASIARDLRGYFAA